jgi:hypothetical protein
MIKTDFACGAVRGIPDINKIFTDHFSRPTFNL